MGGRSGTVLRDVKKFDVNGSLVETLPNLRIPGYMIYLIASKESPTYNERTLNTKLAVLTNLLLQFSLSLFNNLKNLFSKCNHPNG